MMTPPLDKYVWKCTVINVNLTPRKADRPAPSHRCLPFFSPLIHPWQALPTSPGSHFTTHSCRAVWITNQHTIFPGTTIDTVRGAVNVSSVCGGRDPPLNLHTSKSDRHKDQKDNTPSSPVLSGPVSESPCGTYTKNTANSPTTQPNK